MTNASHYAWIDDTTLLIYCCPPGAAERYWVVGIETGTREAIADPMMLQDGHPSILDHGRLILTDTYPDIYGFQSLLLHDRLQGRTRRLARTYCSLAYRSEMRCDLHPRVSPDGRWACVDSVRTGRRAMYVLPLAEFRE